MKLLKNASFAFPKPVRNPDNTLSGGGLVRYTHGRRPDGTPSAILDIEGEVEIDGVPTKAILVVRGGANYAVLRQKLLASGLPAEFLPAQMKGRGEARHHESGWTSQLAGFNPDVVSDGYLAIVAEDAERERVEVAPVRGKTEWLCLGFGRDDRLSPATDNGTPSPAEPLIDDETDLGVL